MVGFLYLIILCGAHALLHAEEPGRILVGCNTLVTESGERIRGIPLAVARGLSTVNQWGANVGNLRRARDQGHVNAVRIVVCEPWYVNRTGGRHSYTVAQVADVIDGILAAVDELGMYAVINYHDVMHYIWNGSDWDVRHFWDVIAPRYKDRPNVAYEIFNEPAGSVPSEQVTQHLIETYKDHVRNVAPETVCLHISPSVMMGPWLDFLDDFSSRAGISWDEGKDVFSFHAYAASLPKWIEEVYNADIPSVCTEFSYDRLGHNPGHLDGTKYQPQYYEKIGLAWFDWHNWNEPDPPKLTISVLVPDAERQGYAWWHNTEPCSKVVEISHTAGYEPAKALFRHSSRQSNGPSQHIAIDMLGRAIPVSRLSKGGVAAGFLLGGSARDTNNR